MVFYPRTYPLAFFSFILFLFINGTTSASFYFQTALIANCYTINGSNCSLINPAFWTGGAAPSAPGDSAFVTSNDINPVTLFLSNSTLDIASLTISGSVLIDVEFGSLLKLRSLTLSAGASIAVNDASTVQTNGTTQLANATMSLNGLTSTYAQVGGLLTLGNTSSITTSTNATLALASAEINGDLFLDPSTFFSASTIYFNKSQAIPAFAVLNQVFLRLVTVNFTSGVALDSLVSSASNLYMNGSLTASSIVFQTAGLLEVNGDLQTTNLTATAPVTTRGNLQVATMNTSTTTVTVFGNLVAENANTSGLTISGNLRASNLTINGGVCSVAQGLFAGFLYVRSSSSLNVSVSFHVAGLNVTNSSTIILNSVQGSINSTSLGAGNILANSSVLYLDSPYSRPNARFTFGGTNIITAPSVNVYDFQYADSNAFVHLFLKGIQLNQSAVLPVSITIAGSFNAVGSVTVLGPISMQQTTATMQGTFAPQGGFFMNSTTFTVAADSAINGTTFVIGPNSTLSALFVTSISAQIINVGTLSTNANNPLAITGKYTQQKSGTLKINSLNRGLPAFVTVVGTANIAGTLSYQSIVVASGETVKLPVLVTTAGISGRFDPPATAFEQFITEKNNMYVVFSESSDGEKLFISSWMFVVVLVSAVLLS